MRELREALLDPRIVEARANEFQIFLVNADRLFLEGIGLLFDSQFVLLQLLGVEIVGTLRACSPPLRSGSGLRRAQRAIADPAIAAGVTVIGSTRESGAPG